MRRWSMFAKLLLVLVLASANAAAWADTTTPVVSIGVEENFPSLGNQSARIGVMVFDDYVCSYCRKWYDESFSILNSRYIRTGKLRFFARSNPLDFHGPSAMEAAKAVRCASLNKRFWNLHHALMTEKRLLWGSFPYERVASIALMKVEELKTCLADPKIGDEIARDITDASDNHFNGTPTFVVGRLVEGRIEGEVVTGAIEWKDFEAVVQKYEHSDVPSQAPRAQIVDVALRDASDRGCDGLCRGGDEARRRR